MLQGKVMRRVGIKAPVISKSSLVISVYWFAIRHESPMLVRQLRSPFAS